MWARRASCTRIGDINHGPNRNVLDQRSHDDHWQKDQQGSKWHWPWGHHEKHQDVETETRQSDLQSAAEKQQISEDQAYIMNYYQKRAEKRKRHNLNQKEHVWQAEERISMGQNDVPAPGKAGGKITTTIQHTNLGSLPTTSTDKSPQQQIDKTPMPGIPQQFSAKQPTLTASILSVAATLDTENPVQTTPGWQFIKWIRNSQTPMADIE